MSVRAIEVALRANVAQFTAQMGAAAASVENFGRNVNTTVSGSSRQFEVLGKVGLAMGAAFVAGAGLSIKAAVDFESAFAGVTKTVDGTQAQLADLSAGIRAMAREMPASAVEIAAVAEAAGQLGVKREDILGFTRVMIDLGETTNLSSDQAATSLARFMNIMGTSSQDVDRLGATLVDLGNAGASSESEILELGLRLAGAGRQAGLSESDVLGFANALSSMGIEAEAGGTAFSRVFIKINDAVIDGGDQLDLFASVAGMTAEQFRAAYEDNAAGAIVSFVEGLGGMQAEGQSTTTVLDELGLSEIRVSDALRRTAGNAEVLSASLNTGSTAWKENTALTAEAEKRYATTGAQLEVLRNNAVDLAIGFGEKLMPAVRFLAEGSKDLIQGLQGLPAPLQTAAAVVGSLVGVLGGAAGTFLVFGDRIRNGMEALRTFSDAFPTFSAAAGYFTAALGGAAVGLGLLAMAMGKAKSEAEVLVAGLQEDIDVSNYDSFTAGLDRVRAKMAEVNEVLPTDSLDMLGQAALGVVQTLTPLESTVLNNAEAMKALRTAEEELVVAQVKMDENSYQLMNTLGLTREEVEALAQKAGVDLAGGFNDVVPALTAAYQEMTAGISTSQRTVLSLEEQAAAAKALEEDYKTLGGIFTSMVSPVDAFNVVLQRNEEAGRSLAEKTAANTEDASDSWEDYATESSVSIQQLGAELEKQIEAYDTFYANLLTISARGREDVARELAGMGADGAVLAAELVTKSDPEFSKFGNTLVEASDKRMEEMGQSLSTGFAITSEISKQGAAATVQSVTEALSGLPGITEGIVRETAERAGRTLDEARPGWNAQFSGRTDTAMTEGERLLAEFPIVVGNAGDKSNQALVDRQPGWNNQFSGRRDAAMTEGERLLAEFPIVVGNAGDRGNQALVDREPGWNQTWIDRSTTANREMTGVRETSSALADQTGGAVNALLAGHIGGWNEQFSSRRNTAIGEFDAMNSATSGIVGGMAGGLNSILGNHKPGWDDQFLSRRGFGRDQMEGARSDVVHSAGAAGEGMNAALRGRLPPYQGTVGEYSNTLSGGIRTVSLATRGLNGGAFADGGIVEFYAKGGMKEAHQAQIARAGDWRVWAEPETGGEAYIPLSVAKRARSTDILEEVAGRFGLVVRSAREDEVMDYAKGGFAPCGMGHQGCQHFHSGGLYVPPPHPQFTDFGPPIRPAGSGTTHNMREHVAEVARQHMNLAHHQAPPPGSGMTGGAGGGGRALDRVRSVIGEFPGARITSTYRSPSQNAAVGGARNSLHMDRANPATDIGGPTATLDRMNARLRGMGGWRELLWRVRGHYDHIHAAEQGAIFDSVRSYDQGGFLPPGVTLAYNGTGMPERILTMAEGALMGDTRYGEPGSFKRRERRLDDDEGAQFDYARNRRERRFYAHERLDAPWKQDQSPRMGKEGVGARKEAAVMPVPSNVSNDNSVKINLGGFKVDVRADASVDPRMLASMVSSQTQGALDKFMASLWVEMRTRRG